MLRAYWTSSSSSDEEDFPRVAPSQEFLRFVVPRELSLRFLLHSLGAVIGSVTGVVEGACGRVEGWSGGPCSRRAVDTCTLPSFWRYSSGTVLGLENLR